MIICAAYRTWALNACVDLAENLVIVSTNEDLVTVINDKPHQIEAIIFIGWSSIIPKEIIESYLCMCYHPSDLPSYRGGSPIQHQIIDGIIHTKGTLFKMSDRLDAGDVFEKATLDLSGEMSIILNSLRDNAKYLINNFISALRSAEPLRFEKQDEGQASFFKRRKPENSELTLDELQTATSNVLYNKIRALGDPYPNAFIKTIDGKRLVIEKARIE